jgi:hypothetical protein
MKAASRHAGAKSYITIPVALVSKPTEGKKEHPWEREGKKRLCLRVVVFFFLFLYLFGFEGFMTHDA